MDRSEIVAPERLGGSRFGLNEVLDPNKLDKIKSEVSRIRESRTWLLDGWIPGWSCRLSRWTIRSRRMGVM